MGLSGTGQWETHCCSDGFVDQADGFPDNSSGPGAGEPSEIIIILKLNRRDEEHETLRQLPFNH